MDFLPIFEKMLELFSIIIIGYIAAKANVLNSTVKQSLTKIILNISLPCTILSSVMNADKLPRLDQIGRMILVAFLCYGLYLVIAKVGSRILGFKGRDRGVIEFATIFSNVGFIGYPVTYAVFGPESVFYTTIFNIPFNVYCYSVGVLLLQDRDNVKKEKVSFFARLKGMLTPTMVASLLVLLMALFGIQGPKEIGQTCELVGGMTTPGALLIIGSALASMKFKEMLTNVRVYLFAIISIVITPLLTYFVFRPLAGNDALLLGEAVIIAAMPVATSGTMLCIEYGNNEKLMAQVTFITTVLSIVSIPLIATFL